MAVAALVVAFYSIACPATLTHILDFPDGDLHVIGVLRSTSAKRMTRKCARGNSQSGKSAVQGVQGSVPCEGAVDKGGLQELV